MYSIDKVTENIIVIIINTIDFYKFHTFLQVIFFVPKLS